MTDKQPEALRLADVLREEGESWWDYAAAAELRRLHEVNAELVEALMRMKYERGFACDCGIENSTWDFVDVALAKATGEQHG